MDMPLTDDCGLSPAGVSAPLTHSAGGAGERIGRINLREPVGSDKDTLMGKPKTAHTQAKQAKKLFPGFPWVLRCSSPGQQGSLTFGMVA